MHDQVIAIVSNSLGVPCDTISLESTQETIEQWDSLNHLTLMLAIESEFNVKIPTDKMLELTSVKKIVDFLVV